ncbi:MAG: Smr/MutS family protein, partial [Dehalococcoidales bacterium]
LDRLDQIIKSPRGRRITQEPLVTEREGRYVIPVKTESRKDIRGIVHDVSNTGATIFIEPWTTVEAGNELRELIADEQRQVERILRALSEEVGEHSAEIAANIEAAAEIDLAQAKARYARNIRGNEPTVVAPDDASPHPSGALRLVEARHPLLGDKAVPLSVEIGRDFSVLVITGPNTGGKTVALKTIGLLSLMAQAGLPIPASPETRLPVFDGIFVDIGDEQSIEQTLSTFSWHIGNITRIIDGATQRSLVLLDELGTSTDPTQGSALALAILMHFLEVGTTTVATTHFSDLKAFAHATPGMENASLDFDPVTTEPTYHLTVGLPGGSNTLETAARLGVPPAIVAQARSMLSEGTQQLEALLADLMAEKERTEKLRRDLERRLEETEQRSAEIDSRLARLEAEERTIIEDARDRVVGEAAKLQKEIRQATTRLRKEKSKEALDRGRQQAAAAREKLADKGLQAKSGKRQAAPTGGEIAAGDTVWLRDASIAGKVVEISSDGRQVEVQAGATRIRLALEGVTRIDSHGDGKPPPVATPSVPRGGSAARELLLLGKRADEAEWELDSYLDAAFLAELDEVRIVHGAGTGALRNLVREVLAGHPLVKSYRPGGRGEGGNGVTVVQF